MNRVKIYKASVRIPRANSIANLILENDYTYREIKEILGIELNTIHSDIHNVLRQINPTRYNKVLVKLQERELERRIKCSDILSEYQNNLNEIRKKEIGIEKTNTKKSNNSKPVIYTDKNGIEHKYNSMSEASRYTKYTTLTISKHCENKIRKRKFKYNFKGE